MQSPSNSVFISYRRSASAIYVQLVYENLKNRNIDAFYDIETIKAGQFGQIILGQIEARPYFMPVLTPGTLDRCVAAGDWVRREFEHAKACNRVFVPLYTPDFNFDDLPRYLPHLADHITSFNMVKLPVHELKYFKYEIQDIVENFLKPISVEIKSGAAAALVELAQVKQMLDAVPAVTEKQFKAADYMKNAEEKYQNDDYEGVIADLTEAIRLDPTSVMAYEIRGDARRMKRDFDEAIADATEAIRLDPTSAMAYGIRGDARRQKGDYERAIADLTEAIRLDPTSAMAYEARGATRAMKGDYDGAIADATEALRLDPTSAMAYDTRGAARRMKRDYDGAIADATEALRLDPTSVMAYETRGEARRMKRDYDGAIADLTETLRLDPSDEWARKRLDLAKKKRSNRV